jgi:hypothetical protein
MMMHDAAAAAAALIIIIIIITFSMILKVSIHKSCSVVVVYEMQQYGICKQSRRLLSTGSQPRWLLASSSGQPGWLKPQHGCGIML